MGKSESELDRDQILRLHKVDYLSTDDMDIIFSLYKKYLNPGATKYTVNCNCEIGIANIWIKVREWYSNNSSLFD